MPCLREEALFSIIADNMVDAYMTFNHGKDVWDALDAKFEVSDGGTELYVMNQHYDYKLTGESLLLRKLMRYSHLPKNLSSSSVLCRENLWRWHY
jgi:hypothetical protein